MMSIPHVSLALALAGFAGTAVISSPPDGPGVRTPAGVRSLDAVDVDDARVSILTDEDWAQYEVASIFSTRWVLRSRVPSSG